jgi:hypothetical protein
LQTVPLFFIYISVLVQQDGVEMVTVSGTFENGSAKGIIIRGFQTVELIHFVLVVASGKIYAASHDMR